MHVIAHPIIRQFSNIHPDAASSLSSWYKIIKKNDFENFSQLREIFPTADKVENCIIFNICGNKYRLVAVIHFNRKKVYIRHILTHTDYDLEKWKKDCKK